MRGVNMIGERCRCGRHHVIVNLLITLAYILDSCDTCNARFMQHNRPRKMSRNTEQKPPKRQGRIITRNYTGSGKPPPPKEKPNHPPPPKGK